MPHVYLSSRIFLFSKWIFSKTIIIGILIRKWVKQVTTFKRKKQILSNIYIYIFFKLDIRSKNRLIFRGLKSYMIHCWLQQFTTSGWITIVYMVKITSNYAIGRSVTVGSNNFDSTIQIFKLILIIIYITK